MQKTTNILPGFHLSTLRRRPRSAQQQMADELELIRRKSFDHLSHVFRRSVPGLALKQSAEGTNSRTRIYNKTTTFWAFMSQILSEDGSCQEVVHKLKSYASLRGLPAPSSGTAAYCKSRQRLSEEELEEILHYSGHFDDEVTDDESLCGGRRVVVVDGTGMSMADTAQNQEVWPQESQQKEGCGFPLMKLTGCFSLKTGALLSRKQGNQHQHELTLFRGQWDLFKKGDILLGDKGYCSYYDMSMLQKRGVDSVITLARRTPVTSAKAVKKLAENDLIVRWNKPKYNKRFTREQWDQLPDELLLRQIKVEVKQDGFRIRVFYIVTTLMDDQKYSAKNLADLYYRRWDVELFFRDIKTTLGMDILRCKTPEMIRREVLMYLIAYNCLRRLMVEAASKHQVPFRKVSFKGTVQAVRTWEPHFCTTVSRSNRAHMINELYRGIVHTLLGNPLGRAEPRVLKRRPKNFQLLTAPRHEMIEIRHRNNHRKNHAKLA